MNTTKLLKRVRERKPKKGRKYNVSTATVFALSEIYRPEELSTIIGCSVYLVNSIKSGKRLIEGEVDEKTIKELGLKVCEACGLRLVPKDPILIDNVRVSLRKLCRNCYCGDTDYTCYPVHTLGRCLL